MSDTAAILLIGNELLSGKVRDTNAAWLAEELRELGVRLRRVAIVPDEQEEIVAELRRMASAHDHVFTSGGVGPTHDDITMQSIAAAFDVPVVRNPELEGMLRAHFGERLHEAHLNMARAPEGADLIHGGSLRWPMVRFQNVWILPGVPEIFRAKFEAVADRFRSGRFYLRSVYLNLDEASIAAQLAPLEGEHGVEIGSYPRIDDADHRLRVTVEARSPEPVNAAIAALLAVVETKHLVRVDPAL